MIRILCLISVMLASIAGVLGQEKVRIDSSKLEKVDKAFLYFTWKGGVYSRDNGPFVVYLLTNTGEVSNRDKFGANFEKLAKTWITEHEKAEAFVVNTIPGVSEKRGWVFKPVLVRDGEEYLNVYLVRQGACPAQVMYLHHVGMELSKPEMRAFHNELSQAESEAREAKRGIWASIK